jgi:hypothetical protein
VHKRPKPGNWLVQDELGGTVDCNPPPSSVIDTAVEAFAKLPAAYNRSRTKGDPEIRSPILYGRVDLIPSVSGTRVSEFELVEPELFFLYRQKGVFSPLKPALDKFIQGIET